MAEEEIQQPDEEEHKDKDEVGDVVEEQEDKDEDKDEEKDEKKDEVIDKGEAPTEVLFVGGIPAVEVEEETGHLGGFQDPSKFSSHYFLFKDTDSFQCLQQVLFSQSSLFFALNFFPPLEDPGIDDAFNYVAPELPVDDIGAEKYKKVCKDLGIVPISRIIRQLGCEELNLKYYGLTHNQMQALADPLKINGHIKRLILQDNWFTPPSVAIIGDVLRENSTLRSVNLQECRIGPEGAANLSEGIAMTQFLQELDLSYNELGDVGLQELERSLCDNATIKKLDISHNKLTEDSGVTLEKILVGNKALEMLDLSWNQFCTGPGNKRLFNGLLRNEQIKWLDMSWNGIGTKQAMGPIAKYLKKTSCLEFIDLSFNRICKDSLRQLKFALQKSKTLIEAKAGFNIYNADEAYFLASALMNRNSSVVKLDMEYMCVNKDFLNLKNRIKNAGKLVTHGKVYSDYVIKGPNIFKLIFQRCRFLAMKPKKKKQKKDFGHFVLALPDELMPKADFEAFLHKKKVKKIDKELFQELCSLFQNKNQKIRCVDMKNAYMELYPETVLPEEKPKKKKGKKGKGKGKKGHKKKKGKAK